jgi:hypothetical protein
MPGQCRGESSAGGREGLGKRKLEEEDELEDDIAMKCRDDVVGG